MQKPLLLKLTALVLVVTLTSLGVTTFFVTSFAQRAFLEKLQFDLIRDAKLIRCYLERHKQGIDTDFFSQLGVEMGRRVTIFSSSGEVLVDSYRETKGSENLFLRAEVQGAIREGIGVVAGPPSKEGRSMFVAVSDEEGRIIRVASSSTEIYDTLSTLHFGTWILILLVIFLSLGVTFLINRNITDPLRDLLMVTKRLQAGEFGRRVLVRSRDEIGQLGKAFNELSLTLEKMFDTINDKESKLNTVLSSMDDGVLAVNMHRKVILANRSVAEITGMDEKTLIGRDQIEVIRNLQLSEVLEEAMESRVTVNREVRLFPEGKQIFAISSSPLTGEEGNLLGAVAVLRDITALRRLEVMRKEFVANVSHELRTPLTSIKGFVETLLNNSLEDPAIGEKFLRIINGETDRMITLINDLLDLSRIESGHQVLSLSPVDIRQVFEDTILVLQSKAELKGILLENHIPEGIQVEGDAKLLRQVATNLIENGIKYSGDGCRVWVEGHVKNQSLEIMIADNGVGVPREHTDRVFERFYRVDKGRARNMGGTGLGLSIVKHIIEKHAGMIWAESDSGAGMRVKFTLPLA